MPRGGARPGAGRKRKAEIYHFPIKDAEGRISERLPKYIDLLDELAHGVRVQAQTEDGSPYVYTTPPNRQAIEYLINRVMGKPVERKEQGDPGEFVGVKVLKGFDEEAV